MNNLIIVRNNEVFTDSLIISEGTGNKHINVKELIRDYENEFLELGYLSVLNREINRTETRGRKEEIYELNEPQATFLMTLLRNSPTVVKFKLELVKQFYQMRILLQGRTQSTQEKIQYNRVSPEELSKEFYILYHTLQRRVARLSEGQDAIRENLKKKKLLTRFDAAFYIGISERYVAKLMKLEGFPKVVMGEGKGKTYIYREELDKWLDERYKYYSDGDISKLF